ncbi:unnamed protein product [Rotaria sp. Silwood2]|nr:unnamed protein product [Rotaria sp. Silwood2]CAF2922722.1 unnamed protein product [Rotaria sp. Silwood2]CAF4187642.1 unnamed protein product [Rotaria sp. Silwood2]CAF4215145.1 unnamed protein product [Rotaria sp. Silwood2]
MTSNLRTRINCPCGKTIQQRNFAQHCSSKHHLKFVTQQQLNEKNKSSSSIDHIFNLTSYLRENDLRTNNMHIQAIIQRYQNIDPYTKIKLKIKNNENIPTNFHIDHIQEAQILACAIKHTPELIPQNGNILALCPLRKIFNDVSNLAITEAFINRSKGQAIRYFLGHYETNRDISILSAFIQTANGKERSIARFSMNIVDLIKETSPNMSNSIREIRMDNGHITGTYRYEIVAEKFDTIIDRMKLDWNEGIKLRNGKIYQVYK